MQEVWKRLIYPKIPNEQNHFEISSLGRLKNINTGHIYKASQLTSGYLSVRTTIGCRKQKMHIIIHKAVALTFLPNPLMLPCVNHKDGNKNNNCIENLEWCTYGDNLQHAYDNSLFDKQLISGENNHSAKLTWEDVRYIRDNYIKGSKEFGARPLARKFDVSHSVILNIVSNKKWKE